MSDLNIKNTLKLIKNFSEGKDWCTNFPDKIFKYDFRLACLLHDIQYTAKNNLTRVQKQVLSANGRDHSMSREYADYDFKHDLKGMGPWYFSLMMWAAVKVFGGRYWRL